MTSADEGVAATAPPGVRSRSGSVVLHASLLTALLLVALALIERRTGFTVDEGSYAIQSEVVGGGSWTTPWPFAAADPDGRHLPFGEVLDDGELVPHGRQLGWTTALSLTRGIGPEAVGLRLLPLAGTVAAASLAFVLADRLGWRRAAPWAFWVVGGSPLLANGLVLWAHTVQAACAAVIALGVLHLIDRTGHPVRWAAALVGAVGVSVLIRREAVLFGLALAAVLGLVGLLRRSTPLVASAVAAGVAGVGGVLLDSALRSSIVGSRLGDGLRSSDRAGGSWLGERVEAAGRALLEGADGTAGARTAAAAAIVLVFVVVIRERRGGASDPPSRASGVLLLLAAGCLLLRWLLAPDEAAAGVLAVWPVVLLGILRIDASLSAGARAVLAGCGVFAVAVLLTQDDSGGGLQWGGRYLSSAFVPVAVFAAAAVADRAGPQRLFAVGTGALLVVSGLQGLVVTDQVRRGNQELVEALDELDAPVVLTAGPYLARLDWAAWPERCWLAEADDLTGAVEVLRSAGVGRVAYVGFEAEELRRVGLDPSPHRARLGTFEVVPGGGGCPTSNVRSQVVVPG